MERTKLLLDDLINNHIHSAHTIPLEFSIKLIEILIFLNMKSQLLAFLEICINEVAKDQDNLLRTNCNATLILEKFVEICMDDEFEKHYRGENLLGELFIIASNAPRLLRIICRKLLDATNKNNQNLGIRGVYVLVAFKYYLSKIINLNVNDENKISECSAFHKTINKDLEMNNSIISLINMLILDNVGNNITFKIKTYKAIQHIKYIINIAESELLRDKNMLYICELIKKDFYTNNRQMPALKSKSFTSNSKFKSNKHNNNIYGDNTIMGTYLTKKVFSIIEYDMYNTLIDTSQITFKRFLKCDKKKLIEYGIVNKYHQKKIIMVSKQCNKIINKNNITYDNMHSNINILINELCANII